MRCSDSHNYILQRNLIKTNEINWEWETDVALSKHEHKQIKQTIHTIRSSQHDNNKINKLSRLESNNAQNQSTKMLEPMNKDG